MAAEVKSESPHTHTVAAEPVYYEPFLDETILKLAAERMRHMEVHAGLDDLKLLMTKFADSKTANIAVAIKVCNDTVRMGPLTNDTALLKQLQARIKQHVDGIKKCLEVNDATHLWPTLFTAADITRISRARHAQ